MLKARGHHVVGLDRHLGEEILADEFIEGDLVDPDVCEAAVKLTDSVFHLAAARADWGLSEEEYHRDNIVATDRLLQAGAAEGIRDWVHFSTVGVHGPSREPIGEEAPFAPETPYGSTKACAERKVRRLPDRIDGARVVVIRPSAVYGPGCPENTNLYRLVDAIYGRRFVMIGDGTEPKTTSYIENLTAATYFACRTLRRGVHTYIYVDQPVMTTKELVSKVYRLLDRSPPTIHLPLHAVRSVAQIFDVMALLLNIDLPVTASRIEKFCTPTHYDPRSLREEGFRQPFSNDRALKATVSGYLASQKERDPETHYLRTRQT